MAIDARVTSRRPALSHAVGNAGRVLRAVVLLIAGVFFVAPLIWLLLAPTKSDGALISSNPFAFGSFSTLTAAWHHLMSFNNGVVLRWALNSALYSAGSLVIGLAVTLPAGYALATQKFVGRRLIIGLTLIIMIVPSSSLVLPLFLELNSVHLVDTAWAVILPSAFFPFGTYLAYMFFATSLPKDLLAAGRIDGCTEWQLFRSVALPLSQPLIGLFSFLSFTASWNNYFLPYVMLNSTSKLSLPVGLQALISSSDALTNAGASDLPIHRPEVALAGVIMLVPVALVFLFCQRFVTSGALTGATKG